MGVKLRGSGTTLVLCSLAFAMVSCSSGDELPLTMKLRDSSVEGGQSIFVTFELRDPRDAASLRIGPDLALRREERDVRVLLPRSAGLEQYGSAVVPGARRPPLSLEVDTEYRFDLPDVEPGFHQLCARYSIEAQPGRVCVELALG